jgi:hypothetical protein
MHQELQMQEQPGEQSHVQTITTSIQEQLVFFFLSVMHAVITILEISSY